MRRRPVAGLARLAACASLALAAAACGGDDGGGSSSSAPVTTAPADTTAPVATTAAGDTTAAPDATTAAPDATTAAPATQPGTADSGPATTAATGSGSLAGTPAPKPLAERTKVTIAVSFAVEPFAPLFLAQENGEFDKENLDVEIVTLPSSDATVQVASGRVLLQVGGVTAAGLNAVSQGTGLTYLANVHYQSAENQEGLWIRKDRFLADGSIDAARLPGMKIALGSGGVSSVSTLAVQRWLQGNGSSIADIEPVSIGGADMLVALEQGAVDAGYLITPIWQQPSVTECCILVTPQPPLAASVYVVNESSLQDADQREQVKAVMRALMRTVRTYLQGDYHADAAVMEQLSTLLDTPVDVLASAPSLRFDPDLPLDTPTIEEAQDMWISLGDVVDYTDPLTIDQIADTSVIEELRDE